ncbi:MAG TPA: hypothetical protein VHU84_11325 [Lacipirellulaceae bacterium]|nr:hypothetical protein [Lacipirellulaceae bacterium]
MDNAASSTSSWLLQGTVGGLKCEALVATVNVARPDLGLEHVKFQKVPISGQLFRVTTDLNSTLTSTAWPLPVADAYVRGNDLVASYRPVDAWPYSPQLYWQANSLADVDGVVASLSALLSLQTHLLDSWPKISSATQMPVAKLLLIAIDDRGDANVEPLETDARTIPADATCCVVSRLDHAPYSYIELASAADICGGQITQNAMGSQVVWRLFAEEFLEKGVIRRARVHSAFVPRSDDVEIAIECAAAIERAPLPLTA